MEDSNLTENERRDYKHYSQYYGARRHGPKCEIGTTQLADIYTPAFRSHLAELSEKLSNADISPAVLVLNVALDFLRYGEPLRSTEYNDAFKRASMLKTIRQARECAE